MNTYRAPLYRRIGRAFAAAHAIVGAVPIDVTAASTVDFTRHAGIVGSIPVVVTPASTLQFTHPGQHIIVGAIPIAVTPASTLDFTRHAGIVGAVPIAVTAASTMLKSRSYQTALYFPGVAGVTTTMRFKWTSPPPIYGPGGAGVTYIWRYKPKQQSGYYTTMFWGNDDGVGTIEHTFGWDNGQANSYYGFHPYPHNGSFGNPHDWEIAVEADDFVNGSVVMDVWYLQAATVWADGSGKHHIFYWNLPDVDSGHYVSRTSPTSWGNTDPPSPALTFGDAPWNPGQEVMFGRIRGIQIYTALLSTSDIIAEAANPLSTTAGAANIWYLNDNPTVVDISDKSGLNHNPAWVGSERPTTEYYYQISGLVVTSVTPASTMHKPRHSALVGAVPVAVTPTSTVDFTRHAAKIGAVTVSVTPAATLAVTRHHSIVGAVPISVTPHAVIVKHVVIVGSIPVNVTPSATMLRSHHRTLVGSTTVTITPAAVINKQPKIVGAVPLVVTSASAMQRQHHRSIIGAISVVVTPASAMLRSKHHAIVGATTAFVTPASAMHKTLHKSIVGVVPIVVLPASALAVTRHRTFAQNSVISFVHVGDAGWSNLGITRTPSAIVVNTVPIDLLGDHEVSAKSNSQKGFSFSATSKKIISYFVQESTVGGMQEVFVGRSFNGELIRYGYNKTQFVAGVLTKIAISGNRITTIVPEGTGYRVFADVYYDVFFDPARPDPVEQLVISVYPADDTATTDQGDSYIGNFFVYDAPFVQIAVSPASVMHKIVHRGVTGNIPVSVTPASITLFNRSSARSIVGSIPVKVTPSSTTDFTRHAGRVGSVPIVVTPNAVLDFTKHAAMVGSIPIVVVPASVKKITRHHSIVGTVPVVVTPASAIDFTGHAQITGATTIAVTPASTQDFTRHASIVGAASISVVVESVTHYLVPGGHYIDGHTTVDVSLSATLAFTRHPAIDGDARIILGIASTLLFIPHPSIVGAATIVITPNATLVRNRHPSVTGVGVVTIIPDSVFSFVAIGEYFVKVRFRNGSAVSEFSDTKIVYLLLPPEYTDIYDPLDYLNDDEIPGPTFTGADVPDPLQPVFTEELS
jgi:hypothetical protein